MKAVCNGIRLRLERFPSPSSLEPGTARPALMSCRALKEINSQTDEDSVDSSSKTYVFEDKMTKC